MNTSIGLLVYAVHFRSRESHRYVLCTLIARRDCTFQLCLKILQKGTVVMVSDLRLGLDVRQDGLPGCAPSVASVHCRAKTQALQPAARTRRSH